MAPTYETRYIPRIKTETLTTAAGTVSAPAIVCPTDADTGWYWNGCALYFVDNGSPEFAIMEEGARTIGYGAAIPHFRGYRAGGTFASPTATTTSSTLFNFQGYGHNGSDFAPGAVMRIRQDGAISGANCPCEIVLIGRGTTGAANEGLRVRASGQTEILYGLAHQGSTLGFYNTTPGTKPTISGSRGGNAALADLLTKLAALGLLTDGTS
jgi:hypothetical protein